MKKLDTKTIITLSGFITLYLMILTVSTFTCIIIFKSNSVDAMIQLFTLIFTLFTNVITAVTTYFFTRKTLDSIHAKDDENILK